MRLGPKTMASAMRATTAVQNQSGAGSVLAEEEVLDGDPGGAPPAGQEHANEHQGEEEDRPEA